MKKLSNCSAGISMWENCGHSKLECMTVCILMVACHCTRGASISALVMVTANWSFFIFSSICRCGLQTKAGATSDHLPRSCHPTHPPSADYGTGAHPDVQPHTISTGLLQCCVALCPRQQHSEATVRPEHCSTNRSTGTLQSPSRPLLEQLHWLPVWQRIDYKLAVLTYKIRHTSTPAYLSHHIRPRESTRHCDLRSSSTLLLHRPTTRTHFADGALRCSAPAVWNSLNTDTLCSSSLALFKRSLKTFLFCHTFRPSSSCIARL